MGAFKANIKISLVLLGHTVKHNLPNLGVIIDYYLIDDVQQTVSGLAKPCKIIVGGPTLSSPVTYAKWLGCHLKLSETTRYKIFL